MDSFSTFPRNAVPTETEACLTTVFEMGTGDPSSYDRPMGRSYEGFIKVIIFYMEGIVAKILNK